MSDLSVKLLFSLIVLVGALLLPSLSYKLLPTKEGKSIYVNFFWPNTPNTIVENKATAVLEGLFNSLSEVKSTYSTTTDNYGSIQVEIKKGADLNWAKLAISSAIRQAYPHLPKGVAYPRISTSFGDKQQQVLLNYGITSPLSVSEIRHFFSSELHRQLAKLEGIEKVELTGLPRMFLDVKIRNNILLNLGIKEEHIIDLLLSAVNQQSMGTVQVNTENSSLSFPISLEGDATIASLRQIPIQTVDGTWLRLSDVASLTTSEERGHALFRINGEKTLNFSVTSNKHANQLKLATAAKEIITHADSEAAQINLHPIYDASLFLKKELQKIITRCLFSLGILLVITVLIYRRIRPILQLFLSLLASISLAIIVYKLLQIDIHLYSLLGLTVSLGFIIDNSIIAIDHFRKRSSKQIILPIIGATITTICPLLLMLSLESEIQQNLGEFVVVIIVNLLASILVALFLIPVITGDTTEEKTAGLTWSSVQNIFYAGYAKLIIVLRRFKFLIIIILLVCLGSPHVFLPNQLAGEGPQIPCYNDLIGSDQYQNQWKPLLDKYLGGVLGLFVAQSKNASFFKSPERCKITVHVHTPVGSTFEYIDRVCHNIEQQIKGLEGIDVFKTTLYDRNNAQLEIFFKTAYQQTNHPSAVKGVIEELAVNTTGADITVFGVGKPFSNSTPSYADGILMINGYDLNRLKGFAEEIAESLRATPKIAQVTISSEPSWEVKKSALLTASYTPSPINTKSITATFLQHYTQKELGAYVIDGQERMLRLMPEHLTSKDRYQLNHEYFEISDSTAFKAAYHLNILPGKALEKIVKKKQQYQLALQVKVNGTKKLQDLIFEEIQQKYKDIFPMGFELYEESIHAPSKQPWKLVLSLLGALFLVFSVCAIIFESLRYALVIIGNIPVTFIPILYLLAHLEIGLDQGVFAGLILLVGLLTNAAIFIIHEFSFQLRSTQKNQLGAYLSAFKNKIAPILITVLSTMCSLIPFIIETDNHFWYSFSITVLFGLLFSAVAMMIILPVFLLKSEQ